MDGDLDVLAATYNLGVYTLRPHVGDGTGALSLAGVHSLPGAMGAMVSGDLDEDGFPEIATAAGQGRTCSSGPTSATAAARG